MPGTPPGIERSSKGASSQTRREPPEPAKGDRCFPDCKPTDHRSFDSALRASLRMTDGLREKASKNRWYGKTPLVPMNGRLQKGRHPEPVEGAMRHEWHAAGDRAPGFGTRSVRRGVPTRSMGTSMMLKGVALLKTAVTPSLSRGLCVTPGTPSGGTPRHPGSASRLPRNPTTRAFLRQGDCATLKVFERCPHLLGEEPPSTPTPLTS